VIAGDELPRPTGRAADPREVALANQLIEALEGPFDPSEFNDEYQAQLRKLIDAKAAGRKPAKKKAKPERGAERSMAAALNASLKAVQSRRAA
jgi:DNA end-binding protein Ku